MYSVTKLLGCILIISALSSCQPEVIGTSANYQVNIRFQNKVGPDVLQFNTPYTNSSLEPFTVSNFKYYISHISFTNEAGIETGTDGDYFLIDEKLPASKSISVGVSSNKFNKINFYVGVDSIRNVSGVQTGALDPANGMFWTWNTGYIMAKLEGNSPVSTSPQQAITYHIGGFSGSQNVVKKVTLTLPTALDITKTKPSEMLIAADLNKWFDGAATVKIADNAFCMDPGTLAVKIADNYLRMFTVTEVAN